MRKERKRITYRMQRLNSYPLKFAHNSRVYNSQNLSIVEDLKKGRQTIE